MKTILLALLTNSYMGVYDSPKACQAAIHKIYETKMASQVKDTALVKKVIQDQINLQREYVCVSQE